MHVGGCESAEAAGLGSAAEEEEEEEERRCQTCCDVIIHA